MSGTALWMKWGFIGWGLRVKDSRAVASLAAGRRGVISAGGAFMGCVGRVWLGRWGLGTGTRISGS